VAWVHAADLPPAAPHRRSSPNAQPGHLPHSTHPASTIGRLNFLSVDELIRATKGAHNALLGLEELDQEELDEFHAKYEKLAAAARSERNRGIKDTDSPEP